MAIRVWRWVVNFCHCVSGLDGVDDGVSGYERGKRPKLCFVWLDVLLDLDLGHGWVGWFDARSRMCRGLSRAHLA